MQHGIVVSIHVQPPCCVLPSTSRSMLDMASSWFYCTLSKAPGCSIVTVAYCILDQDRSDTSQKNAEKVDKIDPRTIFISICSSTILDETDTIFSRQNLSQRKAGFILFATAAAQSHNPFRVSDRSPWQDWGGRAIVCHSFHSPPLLNVTAQVNRWLYSTLLCLFRLLSCLNWTVGLIRNYLQTKTIATSSDTRQRTEKVEKKCF